MPNVILVDDEIWTIRCLESLLADYPAYHVVGSFSDGQEALAYLRLNPCDVVFTDLRMDRMSGRKLISVCVQEKIPVRMVIISAYSDFSAARESIRNGVIDYLTKPITRRDMAALMQRLDAAFLDEHTSRHISLCQTIERAYPECRVMCCAHTDTACRDILRLQGQQHCAVGLDPVMEDGMTLAYLSNPAGKPPELLRALPEGIGISRAEKSFAKLPDMIAEAKQSMQLHFHFSLNGETAQIQAYMLEHLASPMTLNELAEGFFVNKAYLCSSFRESSGMTIMNFLKHIRMHQAAGAPLNSGESIQEISERVGYPDSAYFSRVFKKTFGVSPESYRKGPFSRSTGS